MRYFSVQKPDAVVIECMAVQPQYQWIAEHKMVKSHIGVITNVRPDHLDEMGPTEEDVAHSLCNTIPVNSVLITGENQKPDILREVAKQNGTRFIKSDESSVRNKELDGFNYMEHPSNIAVALDVCKQVGVNRSIALKGMHKVQPDAGALVAWDLNMNNKNVRFVNGMAANDPVSTLQIWNFISERFVTDEETTCIFFNSRDDRPVRTRQMIELTFENIKPDYYFKGKDYENKKDLTQRLQNEIKAIKNCNGKIIFTESPLKSSTEIINKSYSYIYDSKLHKFLAKKNKFLYLISQLRV